MKKENYRRENGVIRYYPDGVPSAPAEAETKAQEKTPKKKK
jgi:hypothetical protein